jgi:hypothetical protein
MCGGYPHGTGTNGQSRTGQEGRTVTGRHAGLPVPSDVWLQDQLEAWLVQVDAHIAKVAAARERERYESPEDVLVKAAWMLSELGELVCKGRLLVLEVVSR